MLCLLLLVLQCGLIDRALLDGKLYCAGQTVAANSSEGPCAPAVVTPKHLCCLLSPVHMILFLPMPFPCRALELRHAAHVMSRLTVALNVGYYFPCYSDTYQDSTSLQWRQTVPIDGQLQDSRC